jgi:hypothetical protein
MLAQEVEEGLARLGIEHSTTRPYSPYQNGKQEIIWATLEGRLISMLEGVTDLTLDLLTRVTLAWSERDYHRRRHDETGETPLARFINAPSVLRPSPSSRELREAFRLETTRMQRRSDGTVSIEGRRFEVPLRFRHLERLTVRYARWDLGLVHMMDEGSGTNLAQLLPLDRAQNADRRRAKIDLGGRPSTVCEDPPALLADLESLPPLLRRLLRETDMLARPPSFIPSTKDNETSAPPAEDALEERDGNNDGNDVNDNNGALVRN